jgi:8-oxo-dGTP pyrophosphatase MutT (NUDIX family)
MLIVHPYSKIIDGLNNVQIKSPIRETFRSFYPMYKSYKNDCLMDPIVRRCGVVLVSRSSTTLCGDLWSPDKIQLLVVKGKTNGIYSFPKGRQNLNELDEVCASRELYEETGLYMDSTLLSQMNKCKIGKNTYFITDVDAKDYQFFKIRDRREIGEVGWKTIDELRLLRCNKDIRNILLYPFKTYHYHHLIFHTV